MLGEKLPKGWEYKKLNDVLLLIRNGCNVKQDKEGIGVPISRIETISYGSIDPSRVGYVKEISNDIINNYRLQDGDILFSHINSLEHMGKTAIYKNNPEIIIHGINLLLLRPNQKMIDSYYLNYLLKWYRQLGIFSSMANKAVNQASINQSRLSQVEIPIPPLETQRKIVAILKKADTVKQSRSKSDSLIKQLSESLFYYMFGNPTNNSMNWDIVTLNQVCIKITDGTHITPNYKVNGIPFLSVKNISKGYIDFSNTKYISQEEHLFLTKKNKPEKGDILYSKVGTYGIAVIVDNKDEFSIFVSVALIKPNHLLINPQFLKFILNSSFVKHQADQRVKGIAVPDLHLNEIKQFKIPLPPLKVQEQFLIIIAALN